MFGFKKWRTKMGLSFFSRPSPPKKKRLQVSFWFPPLKPTRISLAQRQTSMARQFCFFCDMMCLLCFVVFIGPGGGGVEMKQLEA